MNWQGKRVVVVGMGRTGTAVARLLAREGATVFVSESSTADEKLCEMDSLRSEGIQSECGGHSADRFLEADVIVPCPGVSPAIPEIQAAIQRGAEPYSELEIASGLCKAPLICVTGTNGKTTTTELLRAMVTACGHEAALCGNNATPFSEYILSGIESEYLVVEVSSYQLELIRRFRPWIGVVLNLTSDHLARHRSLEEYAAVKERMFLNQTSGDHVVLNADDPLVRDMATGGEANRWFFSLIEKTPRGVWCDGQTIMAGGAPVMPRDGVPIRGTHNLQNVIAAFAAMYAGGFDLERCVDGVRHFPGVPHRLEDVAVWNGITFINDSKSTNPDSLKAALQSFDVPVVLLAGGEAKDAGYDVLAPLIAQNVSTLVAFGKDAGLFENLFSGCTHVVSAGGLADAVSEACRIAHDGDTVLLSPGCASFDEFSGFEERGETFRRLIRAHVQSEPEVAAHSRVETT